MAGSMGVETLPRPFFIPFISLEGLWTIMDMNFTSTHPRPNKTTSPWGGRLAGGLILPRTDALNFTLETSWGYYGKVSIPSIQASINGADLLVGVLYKPQNFGVFAKAGTMFENIMLDFNEINSSSTTVNGEPVTINTDFQGKWLQSFIVPKIKVGGLYQLRNFGVSLSYDVAFGTLNPYAKTNFTNSNNVLNVNGTFNIKPVMLNSFLLGLYYDFA
jgi:hypothetical protein